MCPELGEGEIIDEALLPEFGNCLLCHFISKTASVKPLPDFRFATRAITEIMVGGVEAILQGISICQLASS